jgi:putative (di)nucleoside polyphosphate hydrolase
MPKPHFRAGVVAVVRRSDGCLLAFERRDLSGEWQLPQGGLNHGESHVDAAWRELREETGLTSAEVRFSEEHDGFTAYMWPSELHRNGRLGQVHRWVFFDALRDDIEPRPDGSEFIGWRWMRSADLIDGVVEFRRGPYRQVLGG